MLFSQEIRYPEKGDKFFIESGQPDEIAWLSRTLQELGSYADGYQKAAINLIDISLTNLDSRDYLIYPIVFLARHYMELRLKELIEGLKYLSTQTKDFPTHHRLEGLWSAFKAAYAAIGEPVTDERFKVIDSLISEFVEKDPNSMAFRYPKDKDGNKSHTIDYININNFKETFIRASFVFDAISIQVSYYVDGVEGMLRDAYGDYYS